MGNQLLKDYTVGEHPVASGGPGFLWKIYNGVHKNTREDVSIFICNVKDIEQRFGAKNVESVLARFRHESQLLSKLRHPLILHPVQQLLETKAEIAMVTEPVLGSVSNILLKQYQGIPQEHVASAMKEFELLDFEMKFGMCQVMEALAFCHKNAKIVHANLTPQNIYITPKGHWKISGFHFSLGTNSDVVPIPKQISTNHFVPSLDYAAPEYALDNAPVTESDVFSASMIYAQLLLNQSQMKLGNKKNSSAAALLTAGLSKDTYKHQISALEQMVDEKLVFLFNQTTAASSIIESIKRASIPNAKERSNSIFILNNCELMFGEEVKALRFLSNMEIRDPVKKASFLQTLLPMLKQKNGPQQEAASAPMTVELPADDDDYVFPNRIVIHKILPALLKECRDQKMCLFALPNVLALCTRMTEQQFSQLVLPTLHKHCMVLSDGPNKPNQQPQISPKIPQMVLRHLSILWAKTTLSEQKNFIIPFIVQSLQYHSNSDIQSEAMKRAEEALNSHIIDATAFKNTFLPQIKNVCELTNSEPMRTNAVVCVGKVLSELDAVTIVNHVLPMVENALVKNPRNASAPLLMSCVGVLRRMSVILMENQSGLGNQYVHVVAARILPSVLPVTTQKSLNQSQFQKCFKAVRSMMDLVEDARMREFEDAKRIMQSPLLNTASDLTDIQEEDDPTAADEFSDPFSSQISTATTKRQPSYPKFEPVKPVVEAVVQPVQQPQPVQPQQQQQNQPPVQQQPVQPLNLNPSNPLHALLSDAPGPMAKPKSGNMFFQEDEHETQDTESDHHNNKDQELERLAALIDRAEEKHQFDSLLTNYMGNAQPVLSTLSADDFFEPEHRTDTAMEVPSPPQQTEPSPFDSHHSTPQTQQTTTTNNNSMLDNGDGDDHFDRLLNNMGGTLDSPKFGSSSIYGNTQASDSQQDSMYPSFNNFNSSWDTDLHNESDNTAKPMTTPTTTTTRTNSGATLDFDSLLDRHLDDDY